jgi:hypothetical protein
MVICCSIHNAQRISLHSRTLLVTLKNATSNYKAVLFAKVNEPSNPWYKPEPVYYQCRSMPEHADVRSQRTVQLEPGAMKLQSFTASRVALQHLRQARFDWLYSCLMGCDLRLSDWFPILRTKALKGQEDNDAVSHPLTPESAITPLWKLRN